MSETQKKWQLPEAAARELDEYEDWIKKFRKLQVGDVKMQKIRLQLGTYAQRQDGVQMQRIKFPGGVLSAAQLIALAEAADLYAGKFIHFTTREDAQLYYIQLEKTPDMLRHLAAAGITTREACGNTVRNITASYRSGIDPEEIFDVQPYADGLYRFLLRNKYNQVMGRKFKIAFESCPRDYSGMLIHDIGFQAALKEVNGQKKRGFRIYLGGGLGGIPMLGKLYSEFVPEEEMLNLAAAAVRLFDRHGERRNRMQARMKFLVQKMGWETFKQALDEEKKQVRISAEDNAYLEKARQVLAVPALPGNLPAVPQGITDKKEYQAWLTDNVLAHKYPGYKAVNVRLRLGDLLSEPARALAKIAAVFSRGELRITIEQNLCLPWVPEKALPTLYAELERIGLADAGAETLADTTTCPGADTCRLGITSAKGLGAAVSEAVNNGLGKYKDLVKEVRVKVSGCPNGCAQHGVAHIGFQGAALKQGDKTIPAHEVFIGGGMDLERSSIGLRIGKIPAKNVPAMMEAFFALYEREKQAGENFNACMQRLGKDRLAEALKPFTEIPSFEERPDLYQDWGHENEKFVTRGGVKGECAGATVQEKVPVIQSAKSRLQQAEAFFAHQEFANAALEAYEAMAEAARVPLYASFCDPFTSEQALWEFENIYARSGKVPAEWIDIAARAGEMKSRGKDEKSAAEAIALAGKMTVLCEALYGELTQKK